MKILFLSFPGKNLESPPLGIAYITALLNKSGHEAIIVEGNNKTVKDLVMAVGLVKPDIVGISMDTSSRMNCLEIAKKTKEKFNLPIVVGGPHPTLMPDQVMKNYLFIDYIVRREGEYICLNLLNALEKGGKFDEIDGLSYRKNGKIIHNKEAEPIQDLDLLPFPEYKFFDLKNYCKPPDEPEELSKFPTGYIVSSRGCPHNCTFCCGSKLLSKKIRFRKPKPIVEEMEQLYSKYNAKYISILDDHFLADKKRAIEICKLIIEKGLHKKIKWKCNSEVNVINEEVLFWMKKAGCYSIGYGVEDTSQEGLEFFKKPHNMEQVFKAFKLTKDAGIKILSYFITGGDHESLKNLRLKKETIKKLDPDVTTSAILIAYPGTEIFDLGIKRGWWKEDIFLTPCTGKKFYNGAPIFPCKNISLEQMFEAVASFEYWWNRKKGKFKFKDRLIVVFRLIKNKDFSKIYIMSKTIIKESFKQL